MIRQKQKAFLVFFFALFIGFMFHPSESYAFELLKMNDPGGVFEKGPYYNAAKDDVKIDFQGTNMKKVRLGFFHDAAFTKAGTEKEGNAPSNMWYAAQGFTCVGWYRFKGFDINGKLLIEIEIRIDKGDLQSPKCDSSSDQGLGGGDVACDSCKVFECPGWKDHMGKLDQIKAAIPPPPNWQEVANTFRDTIAPRIKQDMSDLLGKAPDPPAPPPLPDPPYLSSDLDNRGLTDPTGKEAPGLKDSGFSENDIKSQAPVIQEREDPTGGFNIIDPIGALPSQEEFKKNAPKEGAAALPKPPKELENRAPVPKDEANRAPVPKDEANRAPVPKDEANRAPVPGESGGAAPIPKESGTAPIPKESGTAPIPRGGG